MVSRSSRSVRKPCTRAPSGVRLQRDGKSSVRHVAGRCRTVPPGTASKAPAWPRALGPEAADRAVRAGHARRPRSRTPTCLPPPLRALRTGEGDKGGQETLPNPGGDARCLGNAGRRSPASPRRRFTAGRRCRTRARGATSGTDRAQRSSHAGAVMTSPFRAWSPALGQRRQERQVDVEVLAPHPGLIEDAFDREGFRAGGGRLSLGDACRNRVADSATGMHEDQFRQFAERIFGIFRRIAAAVPSRSSRSA